MKQTLIGLTVAILAAFFVTACGAVPGNEQVNAGITDVKVEWCGEIEKESEPRAYAVCSVEFTDGKEKSEVAITLQHPSGTKIIYTAKDVQAFKAHEVRAAVEQAISGDIRDTAPGIVDSVVKAVMGARPQ